MKSIEQIIEDKKHGIDCTEEESAELKGYLRDTYNFLESTNYYILNQIQELFPQEYGEWAEEDEI